MFLCASPRISVRVVKHGRHALTIPDSRSFRQVNQKPARSLHPYSTNHVASGRRAAARVESVATVRSGPLNGHGQDTASISLRGGEPTVDVGRRSSGAKAKTNAKHGGGIVLLLKWLRRPEE
jgi:hypothetical protein